MNFKNILGDYSLSSVLDRVEYKSILLQNANEIYSIINEIKQKNLKTLVYGDYDPDGAMCTNIWKDTFRCIGFKNYAIFKYGERLVKPSMTPIEGTRPADNAL